MVTNRAGDFIAVNVVLCIATASAVTVRFYSRSRSRNPLGLDDWTAFVCLLLCIALAAIGVYGSASGLHWSPLGAMTKEQYSAMRKLKLADLLVSFSVFSLIKASVILMYMRIFQTRRFILVSKILLVIVTLWGIIGITLTSLVAGPDVSRFWNTGFEREGSQYIFKYYNYMWSMNLIDILLDVIILLMPISVIGSLNLPFMKKLAAASIFLLGGFCLVASIVRLYWAIWITTNFKYFDNQFARQADFNNLWGHIEAYVSVFAACLPTLGPLFRRSFSSSRNGSNSKAAKESGYYTSRAGASSSWSMRKGSFESENSLKKDVDLVPSEYPTEQVSQAQASQQSACGRVDEEYKGGILVERSVSVTDYYQKV